ncbi:MAG: hypothetical protein ABR520_12915 [Mycobacteriales bacterium]
MRLLGVPASVARESLHAIDELLHEFRLVQLSAQAGLTTPQGELAAVMNEILEGYADAREVTSAQLDAAHARGQDRVDMQVELPVEAAAAGRRLLDLLERADALCRDEQMLTLAVSPDVAAFRRWSLDELTAQLENAADPTPCPL